jgi:16S rRNA (uracil1498-N3)-methyltransferase
VPHFFINRSDISGDICVIGGDDFHHLTRVRRVKVGQKISLIGEDKKKMSCEIIEVGRERIRAKILFADPGPGTFPADEKTGLDFTVYMSLLKGKKFDVVVQKLVELGVSRIIPIVTERSIPDYEEKEKNRLDRWNRIALEAAKQSLRNTVIPVEHIMSFRDAADNDASDMKIIANPGKGQSIRSYLEEHREGRSISLMIGPEGGFSPAETESAESRNWQSLQFGFTQLRAETAALVLASIIIYEWSI